MAFQYVTSFPRGSTRQPETLASMFLRSWTLKKTIGKTMRFQTHEGCCQGYGQGLSFARCVIFPPMAVFYQVSQLGVLP